MQINVDAMLAMIMGTVRMLARRLKIKKSKTVLSPPTMRNLIFSLCLVYSEFSVIFLKWFATSKVPRIFAIDDIEWATLCFGVDVGDIESGDGLRNKHEAD